MRGESKKRKLFSKIIGAYISIFMASFIGLTILLAFLYRNIYYENRNEDIKQTSIILSVVIEEYYEGSVSESLLSDSIIGIENTKRYKVALADSVGNIFMSSDDKEAIIGKKIDNKYLERLKQGEIIDRNGPMNIFTNSNKEVYVAPVIRDDKFLGAILISESSMYFTKGMVTFLLKTSTMAVIIALIGALSFYLFTRRRIVKPIVEINRAYHKISQGDFTTRVEIQGLDEIAELGRAFNRTAEYMETLDNNSKEFISNVSHELRSPMTSIKGFIGGILDGIIPVDKQQHYLSLAYDEIDRLARLINDLLNLSTLESGNVELEITSFDIIKLIKDQVDYFQPLFARKRLNVEIIYDDKELYVVSDKDRVIQVLVNLIDNAIKYCNEEGIVKIEVKISRDKIFISIYNSGASISEDGLKHIWERFYKGDKSRTIKESTGLGLSIVRNIIKSLNEDIIVENKREGGVQFTFSIKRLQIRE